MEKHKIEQIAVDNLHFDFQNPRLAEFNLKPKSGDGEILKVLWDAMEIEEIVLSIAASGFFSHEPLIVIKETANKQLINVVIEGNRRLAAVKAIVNPELLVDNEIPPLRVKVDRKIKDELRKGIPVIVVKSRQEAWKFIGFKHINGAAKWGSFAKAQYISQVHKQFRISLEDIALQIGDTNKTVEKLYQGLRVVEQAEEQGVFDRRNITGSRLYFSHLYTAIGYEGIRNFLGIADSKNEIEFPLQKFKKSNVENFFTWLFGNKKEDVQPIIRSQNPDLRRLDSIVKNGEATRALRDGADFIKAYEMSQPYKETFETSLVDAKQSLLKANSYWAIGYDLSLETLKTAGSIADLAESLYRAMENKYNESKTPKKRITE